MEKKTESALTQWRRAKGLSRERLGVQIGVSSYTLWKAEHGHPISRGTAAILSKVTGWSMTKFKMTGGGQEAVKL